MDQDPEGRGNGRFRLSQVMSDGNGNGNGSRGVQAYRWVLSGGMALIAGLSWRQLDQIDKMAAKLEALQIQVTTLSSTSEGRTFAHALRLDSVEKLYEQQRREIEELKRSIWRAAPSGRQPEEQQRQQWQQK